MVTVLTGVLQADLSNPLAQVDLAFSILFMVDCCLNFKTAYIGEAC
jgi:hypothetical protein